MQYDNSDNHKNYKGNRYVGEQHTDYVCKCAAERTRRSSTRQVASPHPTVFLFPRLKPWIPQLCLPASSIRCHLCTCLVSPETMEADQPSPDKPRKKATSTAHRKSLACEYCHRSFARLEHLQRHLRTRKKLPAHPNPSMCDCPIEIR